MLLAPINPLEILREALSNEEQGERCQAEGMLIPAWMAFSRALALWHQLNDPYSVERVCRRMSDQGAETITDAMSSKFAWGCWEASLWLGR